MARLTPQLLWNRQRYGRYLDVLVTHSPPFGVHDRPDLPHYGAGEASHKPMIAAIANAVHDATGVRLRRVPFRRERVLAALRQYS